MLSLECDPSGIDEILSGVERLFGPLGEYELEVGLIGDPGKWKTHQELWKVARVLNFGGMSSRGGTIPPRPFLDTAWERVAASLTTDVERLLRIGVTGRELYEQLGAKYADELWWTIEDWSFPPNAPLTIALKGRDDPLVETGSLRDSVAYRVHRSGEEA